MAPLIIEGCTLGQKHQSYNKIVTDARKNKLYQEVADINYENSDLNNLFNIDIACYNRNVEYVLRVLKCEDMLYVSRAIKQSTWLITDPQYAHIVHPTYLFNKLFPYMTAKAISKFILHIRLSLKDEKRVEEFFNFYKEEDLHTALKWLPHCSITFTENVIKEYANEIPEKLISRICERSISFIELFFKYKNNKPDTFLSTKYLIRKNADKYLDIMEDNIHDKGCIAHYFTPKLTKIIMSKCCDRVIQNFESYADYFHMPTVVKYIRKDEAKDFLLKHKNNEALKPLFGIDQVQLLINCLPLENRFELVKEIFINENYQETIDQSSKQIMYSWYAYAPFCTAFEQLKRGIQKETKKKDRLSMFNVLLSSAKYNMQDIYTLLKYYRENYINEPCESKLEFVNLLLSRTKMHTLDKAAWEYLNDLFISMDIYSESGNQDVQTCIKSIILYNVIHNEVVPEVITKKFVFDTCKDYQKIITQDENEKLFTFLFEHITSKLERDIVNQEMFTETGDVLEQILHLLLDWKRELVDFPNIIQKIKDIIYLKRVKSWNYDLTKLYSIKKSWKKLFFAESILLNPNQEALINALKHGPEVLETYKTEVEIICLRDNIHIDQFLKKIRIYWPASLATYYKTFFFNNLKQKTNHKSLVIGLCTLLPQKEFLNLLNKYVPTQEKIDWTEHDEVELSLRKHIATRLHLARPQPSLAIALSYAKGDNVHYVLTSLSAILYNMSSSYISKNIKELLDAPVSLQKHSIRISSRKLNKKQLIQLYSDIWISNKNSTIRTILFCETFHILSKEKDQETIKIIWEYLSMFIDSLTSKENRNIYNILIKVRDVPECVRGEFWLRSYKFFKSHQTIKNFDNFTTSLRSVIPKCILDEDILSEIFLESFDNSLSTGKCDDPFRLTHYILLCKSEEVQIRRHNKVLVPILERCFALWNTKHENKEYCVINYLHSFCKLFCMCYTTLFLSEDMTFPATVLRDILNRIERNLPMPENYVILLRFKLAKSFHEILSTKEDQINEIKKTTGDAYASWQRLKKAAAHEIGRECINHLRKDVQSISPTVYNIYARVLVFLCNQSYFDPTNMSLLLKSMLEVKDLVEGHLMVLQIMKIKRTHDGFSNEEELLEEIQKHPSDEVKCHYWQYWYNNII